MENEGKLDQLKGNIQETIGNATGDKELENEGKANKIGGKVKEVTENVSEKINDTVDNLKNNH